MFYYTNSCVEKQGIFSCFSSFFLYLRLARGNTVLRGESRPWTALSSLPYASKASSSALPGTSFAPAKLLRTPEGPKGCDGKAAGRRLTGVSQARERRQRALWGPLGRVSPCQSKVTKGASHFSAERVISREKSDSYFLSQNALIQSSKLRCPARSRNIVRSSSPARG